MQNTDSNKKSSFFRSKGFLILALITPLFFFFQNATLFNPQSNIKQKISENGLSLPQVTIKQKVSENGLTIEVVGVPSDIKQCLDSPTREACLSPENYINKDLSKEPSTFPLDEVVRICLLAPGAKTPECRIISSGNEMLSTGPRHRETPWTHRD